MEVIRDIEIINNKISENGIVVKGPGIHNGRKLYIESYGCQMNFSDSEIVASIMKGNGFDSVSSFEEADVIFLNTCSIREKAEQTIRNRLMHFNGIKKKKPDVTIGILGCMAERLKTKLLEEEKIVDVVAGPDAYRDLPELIRKVETGQKAVNTFLSREETYADISPVRLDSNGVTAFISIMRGCDNMCSFCVVPFTRGRERSREPESIVAEATQLFNAGYREVTLLGQNVDSYYWTPESNRSGDLHKINSEDAVNFAKLLERVARISPSLRVRFSTSHPKDITDEVLHTMAHYENICRNIHLPAQSGSSSVLERMNRTYSRDWYLERVRSIRNILGNDCGLSSDFIAGFCNESEEEHGETLSLMEAVKFDFSFMFVYSERPGTAAARQFKDDIPGDIKKRRLQSIIDMQNKHSRERNEQDLNKVHEVLIEGSSKRSADFLQGRNTQNKVVVFPAGRLNKGTFVKVLVKTCTSATLQGEVVEIVKES